MRRFALVSIAVFLGVLYLDLEAGDGFDAVGMLAIFIHLGIALSGLVFFAASIRMKKLKYALIGTTALVFPFIAILVGNKISDTKAKESKESALLIVEALNAYVLEKNSYPQELDSLVPEYFARLPVHSMGVFGNRDFHYQTGSKSDGFVLSFPYPYTFGWSYFPSTRSWKYD